MHICSKSAVLGFSALGLYSRFMKAPESITIGSALCAFTGYMCHEYGYRYLDIIMVTCVFLYNFFILYPFSNYITLLSLFSVYAYMNKQNHKNMVQYPMMLAIMLLINEKSMLKK